jgi:hypothetical protein
MRPTWASTLRRTDRLIVGRNVALTLTWVVLRPGPDEGTRGKIFFLGGQLNSDRLANIYDFLNV